MTTFLADEGAVSRWSPLPRLIGWPPSSGSQLKETKRSSVAKPDNNHREKRARVRRRRRRRSCAVPVSIFLRQAVFSRAIFPPNQQTRFYYTHTDTHKHTRRKRQIHKNNKKGLGLRQQRKGGPWKIRNIKLAFRKAGEKRESQESICCGVREKKKREARSVCFFAR